MLAFVIPILAIGICLLVLAMIISPKLRGKFIKRQLKATKYVIDEAKDDLIEMGSTMGNIAVKTHKNVIDNNEDALKETATKQANISKEAIEITTRAIKDGITKDNSVFCKHCGKAIDNDSTFCKFCGKEQ